MLEEYKFVNTPGINTQEVSRSWVFHWNCKECNTHLVITQDNIEDFIDSDPHFPLEDFLICPSCGKANGLFHGIDGKCNGVDSRIWADGSFIYLHNLGEDKRIV